ncbi:MGMT family protein [Rhizohabitans arisaemae]|uniref:MGMT family protein n=1 Tax=Rhizohabitans arisaemae TaxID=2720610 RepID=UPI0024B0C4CA|nr:MGMT family protein [Rhizohabitans arisaemae]
MTHAVAGPGPYAERVLDLVERIPPGRVMTYGDIAEHLGEGGPRQVGRVMALWGGGVPWWRVIRSDGSPVRGHERKCRAQWTTEGTPMRGERADLPRARWDGVEIGTTIS